MTKHKPNKRPTRIFERKARTYDRRPGKTNPGRCILIVCEGAETEPNYFQELKTYLKINLVEIDIVKRAGAPINLVEKAEQLVTQRNKRAESKDSTIYPFEEIWCVFDVENPNYNSTFSDAITKARGYKFSLAISNPAFEYWYVLHYDPTSRPFRDGRELKEYLRRRCIAGYNEAMPVFRILREKTHQAINHSKSILEKNYDSENQFPNPSTYVHLLVERMIEMSPSGREHFKNNSG